MEPTLLGPMNTQPTRLKLNMPYNPQLRAPTITSTYEMTFAITIVFSPCNKYGTFGKFYTMYVMRPPLTKKAAYSIIYV